MTNLRELLDYFVELVSRELNAGRVSIMLMDRKTKELQIAASRGISPEIVRNARVKLGQGISGHVAITGQPLLVNDVKSHPATKNSPDPALSDSFVSCPIILSVPIKLQDTVLGVINVTNKHTAGAFSDEDVEFLCGLTGQAAGGHRKCLALHRDGDGLRIAEGVAGPARRFGAAQRPWRDGRGSGPRPQQRARRRPGQDPNPPASCQKGGL
ncbi:MAG: GAF domain-containing protein [Desulfobacterales bacterium]|nr:GAF domain-containing protein [Desulfobacterales bacterium]